MTQFVRPQIMGVLNVTPDSFSDGGRFAGPDAALAQARVLKAAGADILDIGGESTRPGAEPVDEATERGRVLPVVEAVMTEGLGPVSIDTMKPAIARAAIAAGASVWNDVTALTFAPDSLAIAAALDCRVVLMHMQGSPATMQAAPAYGDPVAEVATFLETRIAACEAAGIARARLIADPGIGFGKRLADNLALLKHLGRLRERLGVPLLLGASRKRFIAAIDPAASDPRDRLGGSLAAALWGAEAGADIVRVHDVRETAQALAVRAAIAGA